MAVICYPGFIETVRLPMRGEGRTEFLEEKVGGPLRIIELGQITINTKNTPHPEKKDMIVVTAEDAFDHEAKLNVDATTYTYAQFDMTVPIMGVAVFVSEDEWL